MSKTSTPVSILALIIALIALAISMLAWVRAVETEKDYEAKLAEMEQFHLSLQQEMDALRTTQESSPGETAPAVTDYESYCNLFVNSWSFDNGALSIHSAFAQVMAETAEPDSAVLLLYLNGDLRISMLIELTPGEGSGSYVNELTNMVLALPEMWSLANGDYLELQLKVQLSDGQSLCADGGSWEFADGVLSLTAG